MTKIQRLKKEALESCGFRGHKMGEWFGIGWDMDCYESACEVCGMIVIVDPSPQPNGIEIHGEAVALNCK